MVRCMTWSSTVKSVGNSLVSYSFIGGFYQKVNNDVVFNPLVYFLLCRMLADIGDQVFNQFEAIKGHNICALNL